MVSEPEDYFLIEVFDFSPTHVLEVEWIEERTVLALRFKEKDDFKNDDDDDGFNACFFHEQTL